jgi:hypothetical protein
MKDRVIVVDDIRNSNAGEYPLEPGRQPWKKFLFDPEHIIVPAAPQGDGSLDVRAQDLRFADRSPFVESANILIVKEGSADQFYPLAL